MIKIRKMNKMRNKRGELTLNMIVRIVLSVLAIVILIYLAASLYGIFTKKSKLEQARVSLDQIIDEINGLEDGGGREYLITSPIKWVLIFNEKELCICDEGKADNFNECCNDGASQDIEDIVIEDSCVISAGFLKKEVVQGCVHLKPLPKKIYLNKEGEIVILTANKLTGVLEEFWNYESNGVVIGGLLKSRIVSTGMASGKEDEFKALVKTYFDEKNQDYLVEIKRSSGANALSTGNNRIKDYKTFSHEFFGDNVGISGDKPYKLIVRYKENV